MVRREFLFRSPPVSLFSAGEMSPVKWGNGGGGGQIVVRRKREVGLLLHQKGRCKYYKQKNTHTQNKTQTLWLARINYYDLGGEWGKVHT